MESAPSLNFSNVTVGSDIYAPTKQNQENISGREDLFWVRGKHNIKLGFEVIHTLEHGIYSMEQNGQAILNVSLTTANAPGFFPNLMDPSTWNYKAMAPYVTQYTQTFGNTQDNHFGIASMPSGVWFQDDWRVLPRFTLNLGLRYDNDFGLFDTHVHGSQLATLATQGVHLPTHGDNHEFGPRFGFAWDPQGNGKTSIRGGAGLYYADMLITPAKRSSLLNGQTWVTPMVVGKAGSFQYTGNPQDPYSTATVAQVLANPQLYQQAITVLGPNVEVPWTAQGSLGIQHELPTGAIVSADYLHNRSKHLIQGYETNVNEDPATGINVVPTTTPGHTNRPNPYYGSITTYETPAGVGDIYDALLVNVQKLHWRGLDGSIAYTLSREKDNQSENNPFNPQADWGPSVDNQTHTLNATISYRYRWGIRSALVYHYGSGTNYAISPGNSPTGLGAAAAYGLANRFFCGANATYSGCTTRVKTYDNPTDNYYDPQSGLDVVKRDAFVGNPIHRVDINLAKEITLTEHLHVALQAEAFNVFNHANYGAYTTTVTNANFGKPATSTDNAYWPRSLQFSARLSF